MSLKGNLKRLLRLPILLDAIFLLLWYLTPFYILKLILGFVAFIAIPGVYAAFLFWNDLLTVAGFGMILGLLIQGVNVTIAYILSIALWHMVVPSFEAYLVIVTIGWSLFIERLLNRYRPHYSVTIPSLDALFLFIVIAMIAFTLRADVSALNQSSFLPDGALYMDLARNIASNNTFSAHVVNDGLPPPPFAASLGWIPHIFVSFVLSVFMAIGDTSFLTAKLMMITVGTLVIVPSFRLTSLMFGDKRSPFIVSFLAAIHPIPVFFSTIMYGPELISAVLIMTSLAIMIEALKTKEIRYALLAGAFAGADNLTWGTDSYVLIVLFIIALVVFGFEMPSRERLLNAGMGIVGALAVFEEIFNQTAAVLIATGIGLLVFNLYSKKRLLHQARVVLTTYLFIYVFNAALLIYYYFRVVPNSSSASIVSYSSVAYATLLSKDIVAALSSLVTVLYQSSLLPYLVAAALSFLIVRHLRIKVLLAAFPIITLISFTLLSFDLLQPRYLVASSIFFLILSGNLVAFLLEVASSQISQSAQKTVKTVRFNLSQIISGIPTLVLVVLIVLSVSSFYLPSNLSSTYGQYNPVANDLGGAPDWINQNTPTSASILTVVPREVAWLTERTSVDPVGNSTLAGNRMTLEDLLNLSHLYGTEYVIVDQGFAIFIPSLQYLYTTSSNIGAITVPQILVQGNTTTTGLELVFRGPTDQGNVLVYKVITAKVSVISASSLPVIFGSMYSGANVTRNSGTVIAVTGKTDLQGRIGLKMLNTTSYDLSHVAQVQFTIISNVTGTLDLFIQDYTGSQALAFNVQQVSASITFTITYPLANFLSVNGNLNLSRITLFAIIIERALPNHPAQVNITSLSLVTIS